MSATIIDYRPEHAEAFERLNLFWLQKFFVVEPYDAKVLADPDQYILNAGGKILLAEDEASKAIIGTMALIYHDGNQIELSKMAVDAHHQGKGIGKQLMHAAIAQAQAMQPAKLFLLTNSRLGAANALYEKFGFVNVPLHATDTQCYQRCDRRWEYPHSA